MRGSRNIGESRSARRLDEPLLWYGHLGHLVSLLVGFTQSYVQRMRESRLWFTQTMREFRRACGKNLPHGLHGEGIVEAKTTDASSPSMLAGRCGTKLRPISEPPPRALNFDVHATRRPRGSHGSDTRTAQKEAPNYSLAHRIYDGSSSHNSETAHICTEIGWVPQEINPKDKQNSAQCSSARTRKVLASFGTVKREPGDTMILPKGRIAEYSSLSPSYHYHHHCHSSLHMSQVSQSPTIRYLIQQF